MAENTDASGIKNVVTHPVSQALVAGAVGAAGLAGGLYAAIPPAIVALVQAALQSVDQRRSNVFLGVVSKRVTNIEGMLLDESFTQRFASTYRAAIVDAQEEKVELFASLLAGSVKEEPDTGYFADNLKLIQELSYLEMQLLTEFHHIEQAVLEEFPDGDADSPEDYAAQRARTATHRLREQLWKLSIPGDEFEAVLVRLSRTGLVREHPDLGMADIFYTTPCLARLVRALEAN